MELLSHIEIAAALSSRGGNVCFQSVFTSSNKRRLILLKECNSFDCTRFEVIALTNIFFRVKEADNLFELTPLHR